MRVQSVGLAWREDVMESEGRGYWQKLQARRYSRRTMLKATALAGAGVATSTLLACKPSPGGGPKAAPQGQAGKGQPVSTLIGRTGTEAKGETPVTGGTY